MRKTLLFVFCVMVMVAARAQNTEGYELRDGKVGVSIYHQDTLLNFGSNHLRTVVHHDSKKIELSVDPSTFHSGIDTLDLKLHEGEFDRVLYKGEMMIEHIAVQSKAPQHFEIQGELQLNGVTRPLILKATFRDFRQAPNVECLLEINFTLNLSDFGLNETLPDFGESGSVEILQGLILPTTRD